jgi:hypothetical protein
MEIRANAQIPGSTPNVVPISPSGPTERAARGPRYDRSAVAKSDTVDAPSPVQSSDVPKPVSTRGDLGFDPASKHYFARLIDRDNGQIVAENPTEAQLKLFAISRQLLGKILKTEA